MYNLLVSHEANVVSRAAALRICSGSMDRNTGKVSVGYLLDRALLAGAFTVLAGVIMVGALSCRSR